MQSGDPVLLRSIYRGLVRWTFPWPTGWEDWRPPADWTPVPLPEDWDVV